MTRARAGLDLLDGFPQPVPAHERRPAADVELVEDPRERQPVAAAGVADAIALLSGGREHGVFALR